MLEEGVSDRIKALLRSDMPPVQFKLLGTLRMMVDGHGESNRALVPADSCGRAGFNSGRVWSRGAAPSWSYKVRQEAASSDCC